jgi:predicted choloylglycine hydrolase
VFLANLSYDLAMSFGCSTMALATEDGPLLARNMDWFHEQSIARASCVVATDAGWSAGFLGSVGVVTGLSRHGFALALNAVSTPDPNLDGYPMLLFLRKVLDEAGSFAEAVALLAEEPLVAGGLVTVVGTRNEERVVIERRPRHAELRRPCGDQPLLTTNDYRVDCPCICSRYDRMQELAPRLPGRPGDDDLLRILTDSEVKQTISAQHIIARPATGELRLYVPAEFL